MISDELYERLEALQEWRELTNAPDPSQDDFWNFTPAAPSAAEMEVPF